jgi:hypothetical protein
MRCHFARRRIGSLARACSRGGAVIALGAVALACGKQESPPSAAAPAPQPGIAQPAAPAPAAPTAPATPPAEGDAAAPSADDLGGTATEGVIPEGYPSDVPVYPGADPGPAMSMPGLGVFVTFESDDKVEAILTHYRSELANNGWAVQDSPDGNGVDGTKEGRSVQVRARQDENGRSEIAVSVNQS